MEMTTKTTALSPRPPAATSLQKPTTTITAMSKKNVNSVEKMMAFIEINQSEC